MLKTVRAIAAAIVVAVFATACAATPTITASVPAPSIAAPLPAAGEGELVLEQADNELASGLAATPFDMDTRIDFTLTRDDVDCTQPAVTVIPETYVVSARYVVDGKLGGLCFGRTNDALVEAWKALVATTPPEHLQLLGVFAGFTHLLPIQPEESPVGVASSLRWAPNPPQISIDVDNAFRWPEETYRIAVHEMAHVLSLNRFQVLPAFTPDECLGFWHRNACLATNSLMVEWIALFWPDMIGDVDQSASPSFEGGLERCRVNDGFHNPYSASDPFEDFAESYAAFVLQAEPHSDEQLRKLEWFASKPTLFAARERAIQFAPLRGLQMPKRCG